jgi:hypothetical protein
MAITVEKLSKKSKGKAFKNATGNEDKPVKSNKNVVKVAIVGVLLVVSYFVYKWFKNRNAHAQSF